MTAFHQRQLMNYQDFKYGFSFILFILHLQTQSLSAMVKALNIAATGMASQEAHINSISQNISNVNTTAYKSQRAEFEDLVYQHTRLPGTRSSSESSYTIGMQVGSGSRAVGIKADFKMGDPKVTRRPYDIMIMGDGFFAVTKNGETFYTRDGSFTVDPQGILKTRHGYVLFPGITLPPNTKSLNIAEDGSVQAYLSDQVAPIELGQIPVFTFINPQGLVNIGSNLLKESTASGTAFQKIAGTDNSGPLAQGTIESSNVNVMNEMTEMIKAQRGYEMNARVMSVADQLLQTVSNIR